MYACVHETGRGFFGRVCALGDQARISSDPPPPRNRKAPEPFARAPARRGVLAALPWTALYLGVEVNYHPPTARAPLASHPHRTLHVVHTPLNASHAGALLIGTPS